MVQPFQYLIGGQDPVAALQNGMAFGQQMRAGEQAQAMNAQNMDLAASQEARAQTAFGQQNTLFDQQQQDRAAGLEATRLMNTDLAALSEKVAAGTVTSADFAAIATKYPDLATDMGALWEGQASERKAADVAELFKGITALKAGRPDLAIQMLEERAVAAENSGDKMEADIARATAAAIKADPAAGMTSLGLLLQVVDPDAAKSIFGEPVPAGDRFKVVGDVLMDLQPEGGGQPRPVEGIIRPDMGPEWEDMSPEDAAKAGFVFAQRNKKTGKVEGTKPPSGQAISVLPDGTVTITEGSGAGLTNANTTEANKAVMAYESLVKGLDDYEKVFARTGAAVVPGADKDALLTARRGLQLQMKELFNLGVLNGPDLELMDTMLVDPTSMSNAALDAVGIASMEKRFADNLAQVRKMMKDMVEPKLKALGKDGGSGSQAAPAVPADIDALLQEAAGL